MEYKSKEIQATVASIKPKNHQVAATATTIAPRNNLSKKNQYTGCLNNYIPPKTSLFFVQYWNSSYLLFSVLSWGVNDFVIEISDYKLWHKEFIGCETLSTGKPTYYTTDPNKIPDLIFFFVVGNISANYTHI